MNWSPSSFWKLNWNFWQTVEKFWKGYVFSKKAENWQNRKVFFQIIESLKHFFRNWTRQYHKKVHCGYESVDEIHFKDLTAYEFAAQKDSLDVQKRWIITQLSTFSGESFCAANSYATGLCRKFLRTWVNSQRTFLCYSLYEMQIFRLFKACWQNVFFNNSFMGDDFSAQNTKFSNRIQRTYVLSDW